MNTFKHTLPALLLLAGMGVASTASASLETRPGGMVYDTDFNITWLADANYAQTSGYDADGAMDWPNAMTWVADLVYGGFDDWRLPTALNPDGSGPNFGFNVTGSELGHLFYSELGAKVYNSILTGKPAELAKFSNIQSYIYWSSTDDPQNSGTAVVFNTLGSGQGTATKSSIFNTNQFYAWAVRAGDVAAVPLPAAIWLFGSALSGVAMLGVRRRG